MPFSTIKDPGVRLGVTLGHTFALRDDVLPRSISTHQTRVLFLREKEYKIVHMFVIPGAFFQSFKKAVATSKGPRHAVHLAAEVARRSRESKVFANLRPVKAVFSTDTAANTWRMILENAFILKVNGNIIIYTTVLVVLVLGEPPAWLGPLES